MVESLRVSAQPTSVVEVDMTAIARLRDAVKDDVASKEGVQLSFMPFFVKAATDSLKQHPVLNATLDLEREEVHYFRHEHVAIAVDTPRGLLTPVIRDAGSLNIIGLARHIVAAAERARTNKTTPDELSGGTFTLTNTGCKGALFDPPSSTSPGRNPRPGAVVKRAMVLEDPDLGESIAIRQMVYLALTYDHRLVHGADAARSSPT